MRKGILLILLLWILPSVAEVIGSPEPEEREVPTEESAEVTSLPEMVLKSDRIVLGKVTSIQRDTYTIKTMKMIQGKFAREQSVLIKSFEEDLRWKPLSAGDVLLLFLVQVPGKDIYATFGSFLEGEVPVIDQQIYFEPGLFGKFDAMYEKSEDDEWFTGFEVQEDEEVKVKAKKLNYENTVKAIQLFSKIFKWDSSVEMNAGMYNQYMVNSEYSLSFEEKVLLKYGFLLYQ